MTFPPPTAPVPAVTLTLHVDGVTCATALADADVAAPTERPPIIATDAAPTTSNDDTAERIVRDGFTVFVLFLINVCPCS